MHPGKCIVWGIIGPYFFENETEAYVKVNGVSYRSLINKYSFQHLNGIELEVFWFQPAAMTIGVLKKLFGDIIIPRNGSNNLTLR